MFLYNGKAMKRAVCRSSKKDDRNVATSSRAKPVVHQPRNRGPVNGKAKGSKKDLDSMNPALVSTVPVSTQLKSHCSADFSHCSADLSVASTTSYLASLPLSHMFCTGVVWSHFCTAILIMKIKKDGVKWRFSQALMECIERSNSRVLLSLCCSLCYQTLQCIGQA